MQIQVTQTTIKIAINPQNFFIHASNDMKRTKEVLSVEKNWFVIFDFYLSGSKNKIQKLQTNFLAIFILLILIVVWFT